MSVSEIQLFNILKERIGEKEAQSLVEFVESRVEKEFEKNKDHLATKKDIAESKADMIKWMFIFWIGQIAAIMALIKFMM